MVVDAREPELLHVAGDRRLRGVEAERRQPRADLLLRRQPLPADERQDRLLALGLHSRRCPRLISTPPSPSAPRRRA